MSFYIFFICLLFERIFIFIFITSFRSIFKYFVIELLFIRIFMKRLGNYNFLKIIFWYLVTSSQNSDKNLFLWCEGDPVVHMVIRTIFVQNFIVEIEFISIYPPMNLRYNRISKFNCIKFYFLFKLNSTIIHWHIP